MKRKLIVALVTLVAIALVAGTVLLITLGKYRGEYENMTFADIDIASLDDGVYHGEHDIGLVGASVAVTIKNGGITAIEILEHKNGRGTSAEVIADSIVAAQRVDVDAISGATASSNVIKKAVEKALIK